MSLLEDIARLNEGLSFEDLMRVPEGEGIARQNARLAALRTPDSQEITPPPPKFGGKGSWYSQLPQHGWIDREDKPGSNALGVPDEKQGIALPSRATLGQWFDVTFPDGQTQRLQQTDVGPAKWTGKGIDISAAAAHGAGYTPKDFPTGGQFTWSPADGPETSYDTEDRTAAGIGLTRDAPTATTFPDVTPGRKRMANGDQQGILPLLGMQNQQPQGLLGALGDPETMAYIGMMLKGMNPYSNIDPNAMLSSAHTNALKKEALRQQMAEHAAQSDLNERKFSLAEREAKSNQWTPARKAAQDMGLQEGTPEYQQFITDYYKKQLPGAQHSLNPIRGEGGKLGTINSAGEFKEITMPEGFKPESPTTKIDLGTEWGVLDRAGNLISRYPKDLAGAAQQKEEGKLTGAAKVALPQGLAAADQTIKEIDELIAHPGRETGTGLSSKLDPRNYIPGTDAYNFAVRVKQVGGRAFLQAYETLKGTGQVTEIEGVKATDAIARMDKAQSDEEFLTAMNDFKGVVTGIKANLRKKAGMPEEAPSGSGGASKRLRYDPQTGKMVEQ
jgi:hypothetical protein